MTDQAGSPGVRRRRDGSRLGGYPQWGRSLLAPALVLVVATGLLVLAVATWFLISPVPPGDFAETSVPAYAVSHGAFHCAYSTSDEYPIPPLYPVVAGAAMAVTGIGRSLSPVSKSVEKGCPSVNVSIIEWHGPLFLIWLLGVMGWPFLLAGLTLLMRASGRRLDRSVVLGVCLIACAPPVATALIQDFHPEDLYALGLILAALAAVLRRRWVGAGILLALACCTKQYALLAIVPVVVVAQGRERRHLLQGFIATGVIVLVPLSLALGRAMVDALVGANATTNAQDTLVSTAGLHGWVLVIASRGSPLFLSALTAFWWRRRPGTSVADPGTLVALVATSRPASRFRGQSLRVLLPGLGRCPGGGRHGGGTDSAGHGDLDRSGRDALLRHRAVRRRATTVPGSHADGRRSLGLHPGGPAVVAEAPFGVAIRR